MSELNNSVIKALDILSLFLKHESLSVAEIHELTGFSKSAINRIIASCENRKFIYRSRDNGKYLLGNSVYFLGNSTNLNNHIITYARGPIEKLSKALKLTISVTVMSNYESVVIYQRKSEMVMGLVPGLGTTRTLNCSASGKVLTAFSENPDQILDAMEFKQYSDNTIMDRYAYSEVINETKKDGFAIDDEEIEDNLFCIAMPILNPQGDLVCSISVSGGKKKMTQDFELIKTELEKTVLEISESGLF